MARKRHSAEEIVNKLRQAEVEPGKGSSVASVYKLLGVTEQTCYRCRKEYGGLKTAPDSPAARYAEQLSG